MLGPVAESQYAEFHFQLILKKLTLHNLSPDGCCPLPNLAYG